MADSADDPSPVPAPAGDPQQPARPATRLPKAPRINPPTIGLRQEEGAEADEMAEAEISREDLVTWARLYEPVIELPAAAAEVHRAHISRESRKFHKVDPEVARAEKLAAEARRAALGEEAFETDHLAVQEDEGPTDLPAGAMVPEDPRKALRHLKGRRRSLGSRWMRRGLVLLLMVASFFLGRVTRRVSPPGTAPAATPAPAGNLPGTPPPPASPVNASPAPAAAR